MAPSPASPRIVSARWSAGKMADFIFIDRDIFEATPQQIRETKVLETWLSGTKVWERK
jgi:predicted amidohydrolase YtcJ